MIKPFCLFETDWNEYYGLYPLQESTLVLDFKRWNLQSRHKYNAQFRGIRVAHEIELEDVSEYALFQALTRAHGGWSFLSSLPPRRWKQWLKWQHGRSGYCLIVATQLEGLNYRFSPWGFVLLYLSPSSWTQIRDRIGPKARINK